MLLKLQRYGSNKGASAIGIQIEVLRLDSNSLELRYTVSGPIDCLVIPPPASSRRADHLWQMTCFELFLGEQGAAYRELNFSPSGEWAAYAFNSYRDGMCETQAEVGIDVERDHQSLTLAANLVIALEAVTHIGLSAVIEERGGHKSYWALAHPAGAPDFHDPSCFLARLPE